MTDSLEGYTNLNDFGMANKLNVTDFSKINKLDEFMDPSDNPDLLKGVVTRIDHLGDPELTEDLKNLKGIAGPQEVADTFSDLMGKYINNVDEKHKAAEKAVETFATGGNIDVHSVMIAAEKANLSMQLTMQLRNKILQAYQEVHSIRV